MRTCINDCRPRGVVSVFTILLLAFGILVCTTSSTEAKGKGRGKQGVLENPEVDRSVAEAGDLREEAEKVYTKSRGKAEKVKGDAEEEAEAEASKAKGKAKEKADKAKRGAEEDAEGTIDKAKGKAKSLENMKETDKGSEKGQAMREEHRRKWWKFWGE